MHNQLGWHAASAVAGGDDEDTGQQQQRSGQHYPSREITYAEFVSPVMWGRMTKGLRKEEKACLKAPLVFAELMSYIKVGGFCIVCWCCIILLCAWVRSCSWA